MTMSWMQQRPPLGPGIVLKQRWRFSLKILLSPLFFPYSYYFKAVGFAPAPAPAAPAPEPSGKGKSPKKPRCSCRAAKNQIYRESQRFSFRRIFNTLINHF